MATHRAPLHLSRLAVLFSLVSLGAQQLSAPTPIRAQADSSRSRQGPPPRQSAPTASGTPAARELFRQHCIKCHGSDGTGREARDRLNEIPDFTKSAWQGRRSDAQLLATILEGKDEMPSWRGKIGAEQARGLAAYVRSFAPASGTPKAAPVPAAGSRPSVGIDGGGRLRRARVVPAALREVPWGGWHGESGARTPARDPRLHQVLLAKAPERCAAPVDHPRGQG